VCHGGQATRGGDDARQREASESDNYCKGVSGELRAWASVRR